MLDALPPHIALLGDTQETLIFERAIGREHNVAETKILLADLAKTKPDRLIILGDSVSYGSSKTNWKKFDEWMVPVQEKAIPFEGILGNHDYWGGFECLENAYERYPKLRTSHWYVEEYESLAFIFLDSNESKLSKKQWSAQKAFVEETVAKIEKNDKVKGFFILGHHAPLTNSKITPDDEDSVEAFTPSLYNSKKGLGYISGHAHGYEHFLERDRHFIVSAGGGGPRVDYHTGAKQRHVDLYTGPAPRPFNYLLLSVESKGVWVTARGFQKSHETPANFDQFFIKFKGTSSP